MGPEINLELYESLNKIEELKVLREVYKRGNERLGMLNDGTSWKSSNTPANLKITSS